MRNSSIKFDYKLNGEDVRIHLEWEWKGGCVSGRGPDDESPEVGDITGTVTTEDENGVKTTRDLTKEEAEAMYEDAVVRDYMFERMHEDYSDAGSDHDDRM